MASATPPLFAGSQILVAGSGVGSGVGVTEGVIDGEKEIVGVKEGVGEALGLPPVSRTKNPLEAEEAATVAVKVRYRVKGKVPLSTMKGVRRLGGFSAPDGGEGEPVHRATIAPDSDPRVSTACAPSSSEDTSTSTMAGPCTNTKKYWQLEPSA